MMQRSARLLHVMPRPLSPKFYTMLDSNNWIGALEVYAEHPWRAPPADTYELLKLIMNQTGIRAEDLCSRFEGRMKHKLRQKRNAHEEVEWVRFWELIRDGEITEAMRGLVMGNSSASKGDASEVIYPARKHDKTNLVLLCGKFLEDVGIETVTRMPYSFVSRANIVSAALECGRLELAIRMLEYTKLTKRECATIWPLVGQFSWVGGLKFIEASPRSSIDTSVALPSLLEKGCPMHILVVYLEFTGGLRDRIVVNTLLEHAVRKSDWEFVRQGIAHLEDIDALSPQAHRCFTQHVELRGMEAICLAVMRAGLRFSDLTVQRIEKLCS